MPGEENVKVAVRVRPFNAREQGRQSKPVVDMQGKSTIVTNPNDPNDKKTFTFDYSYWSFDGFKENPDGTTVPDPSHPNKDKYCDQKRVFNDLGKGILNNAWEGYNATLFAYGQTGSGKSYSVIGYGPNKGIVPQFCHELFAGIKAKQAAKEPVQYEVKVSMLEIYNEVVRDLLDASKLKKGLKIREHPKKGFYAEGLKTVLVSSYEEIQAKMEEGTVNRTVASTNMNATSSRAHTIVGITFVQTSKNAQGQETAKTAVVNLVDLAGSERQEAAGSSGERLKEGAAINQSLSCLGNCISALSDQANGKSTKVPFRDSALTKLLMNALGGNSKTVMIAAISPADINYEETISTLRYADRAKQIRTKAVINEDPTEKVIRELKEENERLKKMIQSGKMDPAAIMAGAGGQALTEKEIAEARKKWEEETRAAMKQNENELAELRKSYEEKLKQAQQEKGDTSVAKMEAQKKSKPHLYNLNIDPMLSGRIVHVLPNGATEIGNQRGQESDIVMVGPGMQETHAVITVEKDKTSLRPINQDCRVLVNGSVVVAETELYHNDRLVFGSTQIWVFQNPNEPDIKKKTYPVIDYEYAQQEIAAKAGLKMGTAPTRDAEKLQTDLMEIMPAIEEANSISAELDKKVKFEIVLVAPQVLGQDNGSAQIVPGAPPLKPEVFVKMKNLEYGTEYVWTKEKFMSRLYLMKEMYQNYEEDNDWDLPEDRDPFAESLDTEVIVGTCRVFLQPLAFMVELKENLEVTNLKGIQIGHMQIEVVPCDGRGRDYNEADDKFVDSPDQLLGKNVHFNFKILGCRGLPNKYTDIYCTYKFYNDQKDTLTTKSGPTGNPDWHHVRMVSCAPATTQFIEYLNSGSVTVTIMGKQYIRKSALPNHGGLTTKELLRSDRQIFSRTSDLMAGFSFNGRPVDPQKQGIIVELLLMKKTQARLQQKLDSLKKLVERCDALQHPRVSTVTLKSLLSANTPEQAEKILLRLEDDWDPSDAKFDENGNHTSNVCVIL